MATELTAIEDSAAGIALQLSLQYMQDSVITAQTVVTVFSTIYFGVLDALNPEWAAANPEVECSPTKTAIDSGQTESD